MKKAALHNLGCKVNSYETEAMKQQLEDAGYEIVPFNKLADVYIINTCTVTNIADRKSRQMLHKAKKMNSDGIVVAVGCYVQAAGEELEKDLAVDLVIGNNRKNDLVKILEEAHIKTDIIDINDTSEYEEMRIIKTTGQNRANIKIQDGCNQFCSYCIIPYTRGRVRSREQKDIIKEIKSLVEQGCKEAVLTGIHTASYGIDFQDDTNLLTLIQEIHKVDGLERIRLSSLEQGVITEKFVKELCKLEKVCPHFHLSLQSGSDETLKRMNRKYTAAEYFEKCNLIRENFENPAITTDVIVGFPGETDEEFEATKEFISKVRFSDMHIFKYSKRKGTKAADMKDQVRDDIKSQRSEVLIKIAECMKESFVKSLLDKECKVLFEENETIGGETYQIGHTMEYVKVAVVSSADLSNNIRSVKPIQLLTKEILLAEL